MKLSDIDKNLDQVGQADLADKDVYVLPDGNFDLYGVYYDKEEGRFRRMPSVIAEKVSEGVREIAPCTTGGRVRFSTDATEISIVADLRSPAAIHNNFSEIGVSSVVLIEDTADGNHLLRTKTLMPLDGTKVVKETCVLDKGVKNFTLYMPNYNGVNKLVIGVNKGAFVRGGKAYKPVKPILYYGSSITQGGCASRTDQSYQSMIEKWNNVDFINLGFSGNAKGEDDMIEYLAGLDCSLFVCDYDHNQFDLDLYEKSHKKLYQEFRKKHPDTPILFVTAPDFDRDPKVLAKKEKIARKTYTDAKKSGDKNVYFYAGRNFYGKKDRELCSVDGCHPNTLGFYYMAKKLYAAMKKIDKVFE